MLTTRRFAWILSAAPVAVLVAALGTATALAATTWTVTPGGAFSATPQKITSL